jgi:hypothetical protein
MIAVQRRTGNGPEQFKWKQHQHRGLAFHSARPPSNNQRSLPRLSPTFVGASSNGRNVQIMLR